MKEETKQFLRQHGEQVIDWLQQEKQQLFDPEQVPEESLEAVKAWKQKVDFVESRISSIKEILSDDGESSFGEYE